MTQEIKPRIINANARCSMTQSTEQERELFKAWAAPEGYNVSEHPLAPGRQFACATTERAYSVWQAARRAPVVASRPTVDQVSEAIGYHSPGWDCANPDELIDAVLRLAAAPQPPEAVIKESLTAEAAPVQLPEPEFWIVDSQQHGREFMDAAQFTMRSFDAASFKKLYTESQVLQHVAALEFQLDELAMLTRKLVRSLRKAAPGNESAEKALDYLKRKGLGGKPLRAAQEQST